MITRHIGHGVGLRHCLIFRGSFVITVQTTSRFWVVGRTKKSKDEAVLGVTCGHAPSRVVWVAANTVTTEQIVVTRIPTSFGNLCTASANDTLLDAAFCHTMTEQDRWQGEVHARFAPKSVSTAVSDVWANVILSDNAPVNVITPNTPFRHAVHTALLHIPYGATTSYAALANQLQAPQATRAVASAVAANRIAVVIPCHRVWRSDGTPGEFRWGQPTKQLLCHHERSNL